MATLIATIQERTGEAGIALEQIREGVARIYEQASSNVKSAGAMDQVASEVTTMIEAISTVADENTQATEDMRARSDQVSASMETLAAITAENSAAADEVSAGTEEMAAQVQETADAAKLLTDMAGELSTVIARLGIAGQNGSSVDQIAPSAQQQSP